MLRLMSLNTINGCRANYTDDEGHQTEGTILSASWKDGMVNFLIFNEGEFDVRSATDVVLQEKWIKYLDFVQKEREEAREDYIDPKPLDY